MPRSTLLYICFSLSAMAAGSLSRAQDNIPVSTLKVTTANIISFDKKDSLTIVVSKGGVLNWVSYKKLRRNRSFKEQEKEEREHDKKLRQRFPYSSDQFDVNKELKAGESGNLHFGTSHFDNIPKNNIVRANDSTYKVFLNRHEDFSYERAKEKVTYYSSRHRKHVRGAYMERDADFLEPASRYLFIIGSSNPDNIKLFDTYNEEVQAGAASPKTDALHREMDKAQASRFYGLSFVPDLQTMKDFYDSKLKPVYASIKKVQDQQGIDNECQTTRMTTYLTGNSMLALLQASLREQQRADLRTTGMTRDSLSMLYTLAGNLYTGDADFYTNVGKGAQSLLTPLAPADADANTQLNASRVAINTLIVYLDAFIIEHEADANLRTPLRQLRDELTVLADGLAQTIKGNKSIQAAKQQIGQVISQEEQLSSNVSMTDGGTFAQDIVTRGKLSIAPDFGLVTYGFLQGKHNNGFTSVTPYLGSQVNFRPYDQSVPFGSLPRSRKGLVNPIRFSVMVGITFTSVKEAGKRDNFFSGTNLLLGMGYRLSTEVRLVAGAMLFKRYDEDYVSSKKRTAATAYAGISIDLNLRDLFNNVFGVFTGK